MLRVITADDVRGLLPMDECIDAMQNAMQAASAGMVSVPPRLMMPLPDGRGDFTLMPGGAIDPPVFGGKIISILPDNPLQNQPAIQGFVTLFDNDSGTPLAIVEGAQVTAIRTAAASGLATRYLAREKAQTHGIFGTGVQAVTHIDAIACVRPIDEVLIWGRDPKKAVSLAIKESERYGLTVRACDDPEEVGACDIVSTVTNAAEPILFGRWIRPGAHINLVGAHAPDTRESDSDLIARSSIYTDLLASLFSESGDVLIPIEEGVIGRDHIRGEIGQVIGEELHGRRDEIEITVYKSLGITAQDLFAADLVYRKAVESGVGSEISF